MKITAIRNYEHSRTVSKINRSRNARVSEPQTEPKSDSVAFKAHETAKGFGIGALLGLGAVTILSGGAAAPLVMACSYAAERQELPAECLAKPLKILTQKIKMIKNQMNSIRL